MIAPWNEEIWRNITGDRDRSAHALLFCGAAGLGKVDVACQYAEHLLQGGHRFSSASHPDFHVLSPEVALDPEGTLLQRYGMRYFVTPQGRQAKAVISIDQVRALAGTIVNHAHGTIKVILVTPAHMMNINAANALLKSLEEPTADTVFVLVSNRPDQLPATIRSRCSRVDFRIPPREAALAWLSARTDDPRRSMALDVAFGAPLLAEDYLNSGFLDARETVIRDIRAAVSGHTDVTTVPGRCKAVGIPVALRIFQSMLTDLVKTAFVRDPPGLNNPDQLDWLQRSSKRIHLNRAFALSARIGAHLRDTNSPLDKSLVLEDFFLDLVNVGKS